MDQQKEIAEVFDAWEKSLPPGQKEWCRKALRNANIRLRNIGEQSAKELLIAVLLFYEGKFGK